MGCAVCWDPRYPRSGSHSNVVLEDEVARIEIALRSDPDVIANPARAIEAALDERLGSDEDVIPDLKRLEVLEANTWTDSHTVPEASTRRTPNRAAHQRIEVAVGGREARVQPDQLLEVHRLAKLIGQTNFVLSVAALLAFSVDRPDYSFCHLDAASWIRCLSRPDAANSVELSKPPARSHFQDEPATGVS